MGLFLIVVGLIVGGLATFAYVYLIGFGCGMNTTGCKSDLIYLYFRHLFFEEGLIYLTVMAFAVMLLIGGFMVRRS
ncbi:hypothetical protein [Pseudogemmobacter faecipullorum]|uniref:Uncharacterized protein n=1 Tax=Pseudogemmobacter faecipullorum TaxID=2755041 RepID=A0ABS8CPD8_9RHOB|nr:hypothetical protein [Pseudogemmobacter faecipullorum]MCB5411233.1 hypothetical protein [Pseudogemmobacter faecipullorum]